MLQEDGATSHRSAKTTEWKRENKVPLLQAWPGGSPGLSPLDFSYWSLLLEKVWGRKPRTLAELRTAILAEDRTILQEEVAKMIHDFPRRPRQCAVNSGDVFEFRG